MTFFNTAHLGMTPQPLNIEIKALSQLLHRGRWREELPHSRPHHRMVWITRGQGRVMLDGRMRGYGPFNALFVPAGTLFSIELPANLLGTEVALPTGRGLTLPDHPMHLRVVNVGAQKDLAMLMETLQREIEGKAVARQTAALAYATLLGVWFERQTATEGPPPRANAATRLVARFAAMVAVHYRSGASIQQFAKTLGVTPTHLTRACGQVSGQSALKILNDRIMHEARRRLRDTAQPVKDVAADLGFSSAGYFSRAFQAHAGRAPLAYRKAPRD